MNHVDYDKIPHRRYNPLTEDWVLVSPHRTQRPWSGEVSPAATVVPPAYDRDCYLCPGNIRANGDQTPHYTETFIFTNDYPALLPEIETSTSPADDLLRAEPERGICRVICYSPRHDLTMPRMSSNAVVKIIDSWQDEYQRLGSREPIRYVQIFENRGQMMGCSNPHPHGQIWASQSVPPIPAKESDSQSQYADKNGCCLLCDYLKREQKETSRVLYSNKSFVALIPFWAVWPFETMILPKKHHGSIGTLSQQEKSDLASILIELGICYDNLFLTSFPYSMGIHQQPTDGEEHPAWHFHLHFLPPLLRSQSVKKHMVGYELLAMPQRDITPEWAAERLRRQPKKHYLDIGRDC